uniref:SLC26A/SulP transporter domain-containing protein n=1 Tax=Ditylenchus dipsaci TaxID=166011 RepID=A0A915CM39_9BILA
MNIMSQKFAGYKKSVDELLVVYISSLLIFVASLYLTQYTTCANNSCLSEYFIEWNDSGMNTIPPFKTSLLSALFSCSLLLGVILWLGPLFRTLPLCMLSTVILVSLRPMFKKFMDLPAIWRVSKHDFLIWMLSFCATVGIDVIGGLAVSVAFALLTVVLRTQWPKWHAHFPKSGTGCLCLPSFNETMHMWNQAREENAEKSGLIRALLFDCSAITQIDGME